MTLGTIACSDSILEGSTSSNPFLAYLIAIFRGSKWTPNFALHTDDSEGPSGVDSAGFWSLRLRAAHLSIIL
jgi:hypothetical protein